MCNIVAFMTYEKCFAIKFFLNSERKTHENIQNSNAWKLINVILNDQVIYVYDSWARIVVIHCDKTNITMYVLQKNTVKRLGFIEFILKHERIFRYELNLFMLAKLIAIAIIISIFIHTLRLKKKTLYIHIALYM